jgi:type I restriction enzyme S subunit
MTVFKTKTIEEVTETIIDYRGKTPPKTVNGIKLITAKVIKDGRILDDNHEYISEETYNIWMRRGFPKQWDILITTEAPLGEIAQLRTTERIALAQRVILLRGNPKIIDQGYYYQALKSDFAKAELSARATGTTVLGIKQSELKKVKIPYYPLPIQRKIATILSNYDDLIENNTRRIKILEEMAQTLYHEWFVKFRFPGHEQVKMVESELGLIPEGWEVKEVQYFGKVITGKTPSKAVPEYYGNFMPFIKTPSIHENMFCIEVEEYLSELGVNAQKNKTLPPNSLIVNCIGALAGSVAITSTYSQTNQQINAVVLNSEKFREFLYFTLVSLKETIRQHGSNGATMINLNKSKFESLKIILPKKELLYKFHAMTNSKFDLIQYSGQF